MTWLSSLHLSFDYVASSQKTRLFHRLHTGALMVQRALYPEPELNQNTQSKSQAGICHIYVLYPPAGIADGDSLQLEFKLNSNSHAVITTPGAGKWYGQRESIRPIASNSATSTTQEVSCKNAGAGGKTSSTGQTKQPAAKQHIDARLDEGAILEWLPQESIYYNHSVARAVNHFYLAATASLLTWDIAVFGRQAHCETFTQGHYGNRLEIWRNQQLLVSEYTSQAAASRWFSSPLGLNRHHVHGSFWAVPSGEVIAPQHRDNPLKMGAYLDTMITQLRSLIDKRQLPIVCTHNYQAINIRYLGGDVRACFDAFYQARELLRQHWYGLLLHRPRIWDT